MSRRHPAVSMAMWRRPGFEVLEMLGPTRLDAEMRRRKVLGGSLDVMTTAFLKRIRVDNRKRPAVRFHGLLASSSHLWRVASKGPWPRPRCYWAS